MALQAFHGRRRSWGVIAALFAIGMVVRAIIWGGARNTLAVDPEDRVAESDMLNPAAWFGGDAYPTDAIRLGAGGRTVALITVRNHGKAKTCRTVIKSGTESLDRRVCQIAMTRAHLPKAERDPKAPLRWTLLPVAWAID